MGGEDMDEEDKKFYLLNLNDGRTYSPSGKLLDVLVKIEAEEEVAREAFNKRVETVKRIATNQLDLEQKSVYESRADEANARRKDLYGGFNDPVFDAIQEAIKLPSKGSRTRDLLISWENQIYGRKMKEELYTSLSSLRAEGRERLSPVRVLNYARRMTELGEVPSK